MERGIGFPFPSVTRAWHVALWQITHGWHAGSFPCPPPGIRAGPIPHGARNDQDLHPIGGNHVQKPPRNKAFLHVISR
ncbi:hypothetical protein SXCC_01512 [Gluconacetobacter sp. SXCC-1]|nr:hypothetical protein SXCC_01512 [Gluconacetobacter sp. SXCC-1]